MKSNRDVKPEKDEVIVTLEKFKRVFFGQGDTEFAGMANPEKRPDGASGMLMVDCGASTTITESLFNMTSVEPRVIMMSLAMSGATMKSAHVGMKTYYVYDRAGTLWLFTTRAYYIKEMNQGTESRPIGGQCANCCGLPRNL
jgi:hypothetical protein